MKVIILFILLTLFSFYKAHTQSNEIKIDSLITAYTRINKFNGSALVKYNNKIIFKKSYGMSDVTSKKSTITNAYKPFTKEYGYGWFIDTLYDKKVISHGGNVDGFTSCFIQVP